MTKEEEVSKITFDNKNDFKFKVAYEKYSYIFDNVYGEEKRSKLNNCISKLFNKEISYPQFYREINQYRAASSEDQIFQRTRIQGQRKREYRHKIRKMERIKRHKR